MKILSAEQIRKWDEFTINNEPVSSINLMERAAAKCTTWIEQKFYHKKFNIFCGKGNNGGDGLAIARQLADKKILSEVYIIEAGSEGTNDFKENLAKLYSYPVSIHFIKSADHFPAINNDDVVVDALFGSGLNRPLEGLSAELVRHLNASGTRTISIDIPSGLFADKATESNDVVQASFTLTFQIIKLCFVFPENEKFFGDVTVLDIGLLQSYLEGISSTYELADKHFVKQLYKPRKNFSHKGTYGHALIIAGEKGKMGASVLCTKACLRAGAGLVTSMIPEEQFDIMQTALPEAMVMAQEEIEDFDWAKYSTVGIGPGIGTSEKAERLVQQVVQHFNKPIVIDADGLNLISMDKKLVEELPPGSILSPHPKEFERLFGKTNNHLERIQTAKAYAQKFFIYIIIKGHYSVLACPDGEVYFNTTGNPGMATGGSGDVLTGILTGLLSQGYSSKESCLLGMHLHGLAADIAAQSTSQEALLAGDIADFLGKAFLSVSS